MDHRTVVGVEAHLDGGIASKINSDNVKYVTEIFRSIVSLKPALMESKLDLMSHFTVSQICPREIEQRKES